MIEIKINHESLEPDKLHLTGSTDDLMHECVNLFEQLDIRARVIFRASLFAFLDTNENILNDYERVQNSPLTKLVKSIIKEMESDDNK